MSRLYIKLFSAMTGVLLFACLSHASTQYGDTGLISQPTAQTLNEGNICIGLWTNCTDGASTSGNNDSSLIVPATITMGLGTFMEAYGSYPNLLFNGDEDSSGRGFANAGFKFRVLGKRSAPLRLALDLQGRRSVSDNPDLDGLTDYVTRVIASWRLENTFGVHANAGYAINESPAGAAYDDQVILGAGVEYSLATRLKLIAEFNVDTEKISGQGESSTITAGLQYYVTPHLTMNLAASLGRSDDQPDWRILLGMSTCQGIGTYNRPVPALVSADDIVEDVPVEPIKVSKVKALSPLLSKIEIADSPISHLEVPVSPNEEALINPGDRLNTPELNQLQASPIGPIGSLSETDDTKLPEQPFKASVKRRFRFPELTFSFNQWGLSEEGRRSISLVAEELRREKRYFIVSIEGHTDDVGSESYNQILSFRRAVTAATHLVLRDGFDPARIFVKGHGETQPIEDNNSDVGRSKNRRVELLILVPEGYENVRVKSSRPTYIGNDNASLKNPLIDPLSIEQAIMDKTGAETAKPAGAFSQIDQADKSNNALQE